MQVAAVQFTGSTPARRTALRRLVVLARQAAQPGALVVLPELATTNYLFPSPAAAAVVAEAPDGPTYQALRQVAAQTRCWLVAGFVEGAHDRLFNSAMVIDPRGSLVFTYRKTLLFIADQLWATPGDSGYRCFDTDTGTFTVGICMDLNDERFVQWCQRSGADVIAFPTNWLEEDLDVWAYWIERTQGAGALVAANKFGAEGPIRYCGHSAIIEAGVVRSHAPKEGVAVLSARLTDAPRARRAVTAGGPGAR